MHVTDLTFRWSAFAVASFATMMLHLFGWSLASYYLWLSALGIVCGVLGHLIWTASHARLRAAVFIAVGLLVGQWWFWQRAITQLFFQFSGFV